METLDFSDLGVRLEAAGKRHARELSRIIRKKDLEEIKSTGNFVTAEPAVRVSINRAKEAWAAYHGDKLLAVFGVAAYPQMQVPWMLTSVHVDGVPLTFWKCSKRGVSYLRDKYPLLTNMVHCAYPQAIRWLEKLGFTISPPEKWGAKQDLFCRATLVTQRLIQPATGQDMRNLRIEGLMELIHV